jgi:hypothetical protein
MKPKKKRARKPSTTREYTNSRFAGEMLVAAELSRLGYEVLLGNVGSHNTKAFDLAAVCPVTGRSASVSVKSLKSPNPFMVDPERLLADSVYVFVITGPAGAQPQFHVVRGADLLADEERFFGKYGRRYFPEHGRGIGHKTLESFRDNWAALEQR